MSGTAVVIPFRGGCPHRERALQWVEAAYRREHPDWLVVRALLGGDGPWIKARAVERGLACCEPDDVVVVADADCWTDGLAEAVAQVHAGAAWAVPHLTVYRLDDASTQAWLYGPAVGHRPMTYARRPYTGIWGGGFVVARRSVFDAVPYDSRFEGWGQEDESLAMALWCLLGPCWRGAADLFHLWHPTPERMTWRTGNPAGKRLAKRYRSARNDPAAMRALIEEGRRCSPN